MLKCFKDVIPSIIIILFPVFAFASSSGLTRIAHTSPAETFHSATIAGQNRFAQSRSVSTRHRPVKPVSTHTDDTLNRFYSKKCDQCGLSELRKLKENEPEESHIDNDNVTGEVVSELVDEDSSENNSSETDQKNQFKQHKKTIKRLEKEFSSARKRIAALLAENSKKDKLVEDFDKNNKSLKERIGDLEGELARTKRELSAAKNGFRMLKDASGKTEDGLKTVINRLRTQVDEDSKRLAMLKTELNRERARNQAGTIDREADEVRENIQIERLEQMVSRLKNELEEARKERNELMQYKSAFLRYLKENKEFINALGKEGRNVP